MWCLCDHGTFLCILFVAVQSRFMLIMLLLGFFAWTLSPTSFHPVGLSSYWSLSLCVLHSCGLSSLLSNLIYLQGNLFPVTASTCFIFQPDSSHHNYMNVCICYFCNVGVWSWLRINKLEEPVTLDQQEKPSQLILDGLMLYIYMFTMQQWKRWDNVS